MAYSHMGEPVKTACDYCTHGYQNEDAIDCHCICHFVIEDGRDCEIVPGAEEDFGLDPMPVTSQVNPLIDADYSQIEHRMASTLRPDGCTCETLICDGSCDAQADPAH